MEKLVKTRGGCRSWVTRESNALHAYLRDDKAVTVQGLKIMVSEFEKRLDVLDEAQQAVEDAFDDEGQRDVNIASASDFQMNSLRVKMAAMAKMADLVDEKKIAPLSIPGTSCDAVAKLPKIEREKFNGDNLKWQSFWDQFNAIVHNKPRTAAVTKFSSLLSSLGGDALESIRGFTLTDANYDLARACLTDRYDRKERIIFSHIQALLNFSVPTGVAVAGLWKLRDDLNSHVRCLAGLDVSGEKYGLFLTPLVLSKLPTEIRMEWARVGEGKERDLQFLLNFLKVEIERRERADGFRSMQSSKVKQHASDETKRTVSVPPTASVLHTQGQGHNRGACAFCSKSHPSEKCYKLTKLPLDERHKFIQESRACFRCLNIGHMARGCATKYQKCGGRHRALLCDPTKVKSRQQTPAERSGQSGSGSGQSGSQAQSSSQSGESASHVTVSCTNDRVHTVLPTACVSVRGPKGRMETANVLFDTGSDTTFISSAFVKKKVPEWVTSKYMSYAAFGGNTPSSCSVHNVYKVDLQSRTVESRLLQAVEVKTIGAPLVRPKISAQILQSVCELNLADQYDEKKEVKIDSLIGLDHYWDVVNSDVRKLSEGLVVQSTAFGWVISGSWCDETVNVSSPTCLLSHQHSLVSLSDIPEYSLHRFWDLETIGVSPEVESCSEDEVLREFNETVKFVDSKYEVQLPWKEHVSKLDLLNNKSLAESRLESLNRRLAKHTQLRQDYNDTLFDLEGLGIISEVLETDFLPPGRPIFYLPHHPVVKVSSLTTKVRPVFDASAKGYNKVSLNDCMESGPALQPSLVDVLIRFRRWRVGLIADITKAFLQIKVRDEDQDVHRFLWDVNGHRRVMKFLRAPFGNTSSPFLLNATVRHHISLYPKSKAIEELEENLYVDDWVTGADTDDEACDLF
ncbi:uncharacterized protein LOC135502211 [Lineus longissimus]|uniref:uncharacterized protein LOC135502211 n=1 Tax=Lineus longissimus TaxID=88925 RepID=UPI002B4EB65C